MKKKFLFIMLAAFLLIPNVSFAICEGPLVPCGHSGLPACTFCDLFSLVNNLFKFLFTCIIPIVATALMLWGGIYFLMAGSGVSPGDITKAKGIIGGVVGGLVILFLAWVFLNSFISAIGINSKWTGLLDNPDTPEVEGWWQIDCH